MQRFILFLAFVLLPGCMYYSMMGGGNGNSSRQTVLEKETVGASLKVVALFPPLTKSDESRVVVNVRDRKTEKPVSNAQISIRVELIHDNGHDNQAHGGMMMHQMDTLHAQTMQMKNNVNMELTASESSASGTYNAYFTPSQSGSYKFIVTMVSAEGYTLGNPIVIEGTRIAAATESRQGGMHGGMEGSTSIWLVVGAAVMGAMMIVLMTTKGGLF
jgi:hypothetical protein